MSSFLGVKERPNLTGGDIKAAYEAQPDTNGFRDLEKHTLKRIAVNSIAEMATIDDFLDGQICVILGTGERFQYDANSTLAADGKLIVNATGMVSGRLVSTRTKFYTVADILADVRTFAVGAILTAVELRYEVVSSGEHLTTAGGVKLKVLPIWVGAAGGIYILPAFGAVGDDTTDNTAAIQKAVDVASHLMVPDGVYLSDPITLHSDLTIEGPGTFKMKANSESDSIVHFMGMPEDTVTEYENITIRGITLDGNRSAMPSGRRRT